MRSQLSLTMALLAALLSIRTTLARDLRPPAAGLSAPSQGSVRQFFSVRTDGPNAPGWIQSNLDGFGSPQNAIVTALASFGGQLYAGTYNTSGNGAQLWRKGTGGGWNAAMTDGFGDPANNWGINHLIEFKGNLYASTWRWTSQPNGGQIWRSSDGLSWTRVVSQGFGDPTNGEIFRFAVFSDTLYASTTSYTAAHGAEIWRSDTGDAGDWERVVSNGFGDAQSISVVSLAAFERHLYAGTWNAVSGGTVWRTGDGVTWARISAPGFGDVRSFVISSLAPFQGYLYASVGHWEEPRNFDSMDGIEIWRCQLCDGSDWTRMVDLAFWPDRTGEQSAMRELQGHLYLVVGNQASGLQVWRTADGAEWRQIGFAGLGDRNNTRPRWDNSVAVFAGSLYVGTENPISGGEVWQYLPNALFLPTVQR